MEVSKATYSTGSPHGTNACSMREPYRAKASILSLSSQRRNRRTVLCAYWARLTTYGAHAVRFIQPEWMRPTIIHTKVLRWRWIHPSGMLAQDKNQRLIQMRCVLHAALPGKSVSPGSIRTSHGEQGEH